MAKSRVDITLCQHGKFPATLLLKFFVLYYKRNIKHFFRIDIQLYQRENWKNSKLCENTPLCGCRVSTQFLVFPISTRVDITVYQYGKCFIFLKYKSGNFARLNLVYYANFPLYPKLGQLIPTIKIDRCVIRRCTKFWKYFLFTNRKEIFLRLVNTNSTKSRDLLLFHG